MINAHRKCHLRSLTLAMVLVATSTSFVSATVAGPLKNTLYGSDLQPIGRFAIVDKKLELISSGAHFGITFTGTEVTLVVSMGPWQDHNYIQYELDGNYQKRFRVNSTTPDIIQITAPSDGSHTLWIYKATEAHTGPVFIHHVIAKDIKALPVPALPLIEFIGNSITCGAASDPSEVACGTGAYHDQHNAYMAYGPRVARALNSEFILSSVSGIGIYRTWNNDHPSMPAVYEKADFKEENSRLWDFSAFTPRVVTIALGTNDLSNGDGKTSRLPFDSAVFTNAYVKFVNTVKSKYPEAQVVLMNSPMISGNNNEVLVDCLRKVKAQVDALYPSGRPVALFFFKPMQPRGCSYHPNVEDHRILADQLYPFLGKLLSEMN
jgi:lysophospholipase L1-like esterase